jgi:hypothetical protein
METNLTLGFGCVFGGLFWGVMHGFQNVGFVAISLLIGVGFIVSHLFKKED